MPLYYGNSKVKNLYLGSTKIKEAYLGSTLVYRASQYAPGQVVFEKSSPGTFTLNLLEDGIYEVTCVAGGASGVARLDNTDMIQIAGGASGSAFKAQVRMYKRSYSIVVGAGGTTTAKNGTFKYPPLSDYPMTYTVKGYTGSAGGVSSISSIVYCRAQAATGHNGMNTYYKNDGAPIVYTSPISTIINKAGNNASYSEATISIPSKSGAVSAYNNSASGAGAGGSASGTTNNFVITMTVTKGKNGYVKIVYLGS